MEYKDWLLLITIMMEEHDPKEYLDKESMKEKVNKIIEEMYKEG